MVRDCFDHEKLRVYQEAIAFIAWCHNAADGLAGDAPLMSQLNRAAASIPLNIAEANGKRSNRDRCRFLDMARGSAFECAACLDVLVARKQAAAEDVVHGKHLLRGIVAMLVGLTASLSARVGEEEEVGYSIREGVEHEQEHEQGQEQEHEQEQEQENE